MFNNLTILLKNAAESGILKYSGSTFAELRDITAKNEAVGKLFSQISGSFNSRLEGFYEEKAIKYGEDASFIISLLPESIPDSFTSEENGDTAVLTLTYSKVFGNMYFSGADKTALTMFMKENEIVKINKAVFKNGKAELKMDDDYDEVRVYVYDKLTSPKFDLYEKMNLNYFYF